MKINTIVETFDQINNTRENLTNKKNADQNILEYVWLN